MLIATVIAPIAGLLLLGWLLRQRDFPGNTFWGPLEKLIYFLLMPALLVNSMAGASMRDLPYEIMGVAILGPMLLMTVFTLILRPALNCSGPAFTSFFQGAIRMNSYIGLTLSYGLHGEAGLVAAAVAMALIIPLANVLCVFMLAHHGSLHRIPSALGILKQLATNPLILACVIGVGLNLSGIGKPPVLGDMMDILGRAALPLGLLAVGAALNFKALKGTGQLTFVSSVLKLAVLPLMTWLIGSQLGLTGTPLAVAIIFNALPTATNAYILARQLGGDAPLMAGICTFQTLLSLLTLPAVLLLP